MRVLFSGCEQLIRPQAGGYAWLLQPIEITNNIVRKSCPKRKFKVWRSGMGASRPFLVDSKPQIRLALKRLGYQNLNHWIPDGDDRQKPRVPANAATQPNYWGSEAAGNFRDPAEQLLHTGSRDSFIMTWQFKVVELFLFREEDKEDEGEGNTVAKVRSQTRKKRIFSFKKR